MSSPIHLNFSDPNQVSIGIHIIFLVFISISYLSDVLKRYMYDDFYYFFKNNREVLLGLYYAFVASDYIRKWREIKQT